MVDSDVVRQKSRSKKIVSGWFCDAHGNMEELKSCPQDNFLDLIQKHWPGKGIHSFVQPESDATLYHG